MTAVNFLTDTISLTVKTGNTDSGDPSYGAATSVAAKFVKTSMLIRDANGKEITSDSHVFIPRETSVNPEDKVTHDSVTYRILRVLDQIGTVTTLKYKKLLLQRTKV